MMTGVLLVLAGSEVRGGRQRSPEPRHPDEAQLRHARHARDPGPGDPLDHGPRHPGQPAHQHSSTGADPEHRCNRERLVMGGGESGDCRLDGRCSGAAAGNNNERMVGVITAADDSQ